LARGSRDPCYFSRRIEGLPIGLTIAWFFFVSHREPFFDQRSGELGPTQKSIAVLPFENISANKDDAYFADGVQDEILNNLAKIGQLKVICRTSLMQYRADGKRDVRQIANALGVANVLEGTVRRDGNHVRVSTELVDARNYNTIWADSYDRDLNDIFAIQSEIAQNVASRLRAKLSREERKDVEETPTNNLEAYDLYLQAKQLLSSNYWPSPRPIDTAPKDGTLILILGKYRITEHPPFSLVYWDSQYEYWVNENGAPALSEESILSWWPLPIFELVEEAK
jgi:TolB-like protein